MQRLELRNKEVKEAMNQQTERTQAYETTFRNLQIYRMLSVAFASRKKHAFNWAEIELMTIGIDLSSGISC